MMVVTVMVIIGGLGSVLLGGHKPNWLPPGP